MLQTHLANYHHVRGPKPRGKDYDWRPVYPPTPLEAALFRDWQGRGRRVDQGWIVVAPAGVAAPGGGGGAPVGVAAPGGGGGANVGVAAPGGGGDAPAGPEAPGGGRGAPAGAEAPGGGGRAPAGRVAPRGGLRARWRAIAERHRPY